MREGAYLRKGVWSVPKTTVFETPLTQKLTWTRFVSTKQSELRFRALLTEKGSRRLELERV